MLAASQIHAGRNGERLLPSVLTPGEFGPRVLITINAQIAYSPHAHEHEQHVLSLIGLGSSCFGRIRAFEDLDYNQRVRRQLKMRFSGNWNFRMVLETQLL